MTDPSTTLAEMLAHALANPETVKLFREYEDTRQQAIALGVEIAYITAFHYERLRASEQLTPPLSPKDVLRLVQQIPKEATA